jgi:UDP-2,3-diacylglucosamine hydrolase
VPRLGNHLVLAGDLFDFWFEYRSVIPASAFPILSALDTLRAGGVRLSVLGGNHDRWGGDFWRTHLGAIFSRDTLEIELAGRRALLHHGDGLAEQHRSAAVMHRITRHPATAFMFRWVHPDVGIWLVRRMSRLLGQSTRDDAVLERARRAQEEYARRMLAQRDDVSLVVLAHTHRPALTEVDAGRWYLNPGSWMTDMRYAIVDRNGPRLEQFGAGGCVADVVT